MVIIHAEDFIAKRLASAVLTSDDKKTRFGATPVSALRAPCTRAARDAFKTRS